MNYTKLLLNLSIPVIDYQFVITITKCLLLSITCTRYFDVLTSSASKIFKEQ